MHLCHILALEKPSPQLLYIDVIDVYRFSEIKSTGELQDSVSPTEAIANGASGML